MKTLNVQNEVLESRRLLSNSLAWGMGWGYPEVFDGATDVAVDPAGNAYVMGVFRGKVDVDPSASGKHFLNSKGSKDDVFVCKYNSQGKLVWAKRIGGVGIDTADALAIGSDDSLYIGGTFKNQATVGNVALKGKGGSDGFIAKLTRSGGKVLWAGGFGGERDDQLNSIAVGPGGELYLSGVIRMNGDIDPSNKTRNIVTRGTDDNFIERLNPANGSIVWSKVYGENHTIETVQNLVATPDGGVVAAGFFNETLPLNRSSSKFNVTTVGWYDIYMVKLDKGGAFKWSTSFGGKKLDTLGDITVSSTGDFYVTGNFIKTITLGNTTLETDFETQAYVAKFNGSGKAVWAKSFGSEGNLKPSAIAVGVDGTVFTTGTFDELTDFDPGAGTKILDVDKDDAGYLPDLEYPADTYISTFTTAGEYLNTHRIGGENGTVAVKDIATGPSGGLVLVGQYANKINYNPFTGAKKFVRTVDDEDDSDVLIMKLKMITYV